MLGLAILLLFNLLGLLLHSYCHVPLPGNVAGLLLLLAALSTGVVKLEWVEETAGFLLRHMLLFFAPVIVGTLALTQLIAANLVPVLGVVVLSTLVTALVTGATASLFHPKDPL